MSQNGQIHKFSNTFVTLDPSDSIVSVSGRTFETMTEWTNEIFVYSGIDCSDVYHSIAITAPQLPPLFSQWSTKRSYSPIASLLLLVGLVDCLSG